jgi:lipoyl(octanoyl) transferase
MEMAQMRQWVENITPEIARPHLLNAFLALLNNPPHKYITA